MQLIDFIHSTAASQYSHCCVFTGEGCVVAKLDINQRSEIALINPNDYHLLGFTICNQYPTAVFCLWPVQKFQLRSAVDFADRST